MNIENVGILSLLPPIIAITLALCFKEVVISLFMGIVTSAVIYAAYFNSGFLNAFKLIFTSIAENLAEHILVVIFLSLLGALIKVITMGGGAEAYGNWASKKIHNGKLAKISTAVLGILLSIDDYFNCLTVGAAMRPITDKHKISRPKLAYLLSSIAAPVCVIAPISSWAASISSCISEAGLNGMNTFLATIPYNFYSLLTIIFIFLVSSTKDFGHMKKHEENAKIKFNDELTNSDEETRKSSNSKSKVIDLVLPLAVLLIVSVFLMLETGGFFTGMASVTQAFGKADSNLAITIGAFSALVMVFILFIPRKILSLKQFVEGITKGTCTMVSVFMILTLAWTLSDICKNQLGTGVYIADLFMNTNISPFFIPAILFVVSGVLALATGTSWGTFTILIPVAVMVCQRVSPEITVIALSAVLAGSAFGDHSSPVSCTMIMSSASSGCDHMQHVTSQLQYTLLVGFSTLVGYTAIGLTKNLLISFAVAFGVMLILFLNIEKFLGNFKDLNKKVKNI